jgi:hypothetical protein
MSISRIRHAAQPVALALALLAGCADSATGPSTTPRAAADASDPVDITGTWSYHEDATFLIYGDHSGAVVFRCSSDGVYTFAQTGETFTGSYVQTGLCTGSDGSSFPNDFDGVGVSGTVSAQQLQFDTADGCTYEGAVRGATDDAMGGAARCGGAAFGGTYRATWSATRS